MSDDEAADIIFGAVADMELAHFTKREIVTTLREAADEIESDMDAEYTYDGDSWIIE